ncbi:hypothetical protein E3C22_21285 [Jiella endophytica]|uniref:Argininosuccinate lyase n=1 Tax=Jiella endophytica TaxID=2558362 RepID=A0A4Y8RBQ4_9HYPH|nr:hypothetical protein [Jiella endophytica]TFF18757.1 hypothetical protein E3C22_21285 [Jiella endophytica]
MKKRSLKLVWTSLVATALLAGCGVKNLPVGPTTKEVPPVVKGADNSRKSGDTAAMLRPKSLTDASRNLSISGAEVSKNDVPPRPFILDPLLN